MFDVDLDRLRARRTVKWSLYGPDVLAAWVAEMDFDVAPVVRAAISDAVEREDFGYVEADLSELTGACAEFLAGQYEWSVPATRVFPIADVLSGIRLALETFGRPGEPVVVPTPAYPPFFDLVELAGRPIVEAPMVVDTDDRWSLDLDRIDAALAGGATAVLLCNPHNPTGRAFAPAELSALADIVDRHGARVVADEVHAPLVLGGARHVPYASVSDAAAAHALTVTSASKAFNLAGLKCAQVVASNHDDAARWRRLPMFGVPGPTPLGIAASTAAYRDGGTWLSELRRVLAANHRRVAAVLADAAPEVVCRPAEATFVAWIDCSALGLDDPAGHVLARGGVALSHGAPFGSDHAQFVRLNVGTSPALLERVVAATAGALRPAS